MSGLPEEGELVIATVKDVTTHGAYVTLDEYDNMLAFLHVSEVATGWVRSIERFAREGQKMILKVIRVNKARREVDLSLKQVTDDERRRKMIEIKKEGKAKVLIASIKEKCNYTDEEMNKYIDRIHERYELIYDMFEDVAKNSKVLSKIDLPEKMKSVIIELSNSIKMPSVQVRGMMEITCMRPNGINVIKKVLSVDDDSVEIRYVGAPRYRISVNAENFKVAERMLSKIIDGIESSLKKQGCTFKFTREESKKGGVV